MTKPIVQFLRQLGIHLIIYLHDLLLAASSTTQLLQDLSTVLQLFTAQGFLINYPKSIMNPTQKLESLGFMVDVKTMRITLPPQKIDAIQKEASQILSAGSIQIRTLAHFIGTLVATKPAVPLGPLHFRALQDLKTQALICHQATYQSLVQLSQAAQTDLQWWITQLPLHYSTTILRTEASIVIESNASRLGWGAVCREVHTGGRWTPQNWITTSITLS